MGQIQVLALIKHPKSTHQARLKLCSSSTVRLRRLALDRRRRRQSCVIVFTALQIFKHLRGQALVKDVTRGQGVLLGVWAFVGNIGLQLKIEIEGE